MSKRNLSSPDNDRNKNRSPATPTYSTRFTIEQKVSGAKKGPRNVKRTIDAKDVVIHRRFGEGSTPIFSREDVHVNVVPTKSDTPKKQRSSSNSSSEHIRHKTHASRRGISHSPKRKKVDRKTPEKLPYFIDAKREEDRLRAKYGNSRGTNKTRSRSRSRRRTRSRSRSSSKFRRRHRSRSRSMRRHRSRSRKRYRSYSRHRSPNRSERHRYRSSSRDKSRRRSPYQEQRFIPVAIPVEYPCPASWIAPQMPPYPRHPFMIRPTLPPPIPFYPLRPPFVPMDYPRRPIRFPGRHIRPYRPGPPK